MQEDAAALALSEGLYDGVRVEEKGRLIGLLWHSRTYRVNVSRAAIVISDDTPSAPGVSACPSAPERLPPGPFLGAIPLELLTTYYLLPTTFYFLLSTCYLLLTTYYLPVSTYYVLVTIHYL